MKDIIIFLSLFALAKPVFGQGDSSIIEGEWYQCRINGQYLEYVFKGGKFSQQHELGELNGVYQIKNDTIYYKDERSYHWDYKMYFQKTQNNNSLAVKEFDFLYPDMNSNFFLYEIKPRLIENSTFLERKKNHQCIDKRSDEQKKMDSLKEIETTRQINLLIKDLDSLRNLEKKKN
ncbi:MAG: hypothetical protein RLO12_16835 [Fulvivirga sp.]